MQALLDLFVGALALVAAAALSQFGVDLQRTPSPDREVHRTAACEDAAHAPRLVQALAPAPAPPLVTGV